MISRLGLYLNIVIAIRLAMNDISNTAQTIIGVLSRVAMKCIKDASRIPGGISKMLISPSVMSADGFRSASSAGIELIATSLPSIACFCTAIKIIPEAMMTSVMKTQTRSVSPNVLLNACSLFWYFPGSAFINNSLLIYVQGFEKHRYCSQYYDYGEYS